MTKTKFLLFLPCLILGSILAVSSSSWVSAWMGLEINLMSIAPILISNKSFLSVEASLKYFLIQAISSIILTFSFFFSLSLTLVSTDQILKAMMTASLMLKAGVAPLHFWFPQMMAYLNWPQCFIILTWQKLAPMGLLSLLKSNLFLVFIMMSAFIGAAGGINTNQTKTILAYSSIIHSAWMLSIIWAHETLWILYFLSYTIINATLVIFFSLFELSSIISIFLCPQPIMHKLLVSMNIMSLAGMPPFLGFIIKLMAISQLMTSDMPLPLVVTLLGASFLAFYFYLRIILNSLFLVSNTALCPLPPSYSTSNLTSLVAYTLTISGNMMAPLIVTLT